MKKKTLFLWRQEANALGKNLEDMRYDPEYGNDIPTHDQAMEQMHPVVKAMYRNDYAHSHSMGFYETLSEIVKAFSKLTWRRSSWQDRQQKVPELEYWSEEDRFQLEKMFLNI